MIMFVIAIFVALAVTVCAADIPVTPPGPTPAPIRCGEIPSTIYSCVGNPKLIKPEVASQQCQGSTDECEKLKCVFEKSGWLDGDKVDKTKFSAHLDKFATDNPNWSAAVQHAKSVCMTNDLPAQGVFVNCAPYDVMSCTLTEFIRNAQPSQWSTSKQCEYPRQFAAACPVCPNDCFAPLVPYRSCNACMLLPRSP